MKYLRIFSLRRFIALMGVSVMLAGCGNGTPAPAPSGLRFLNRTVHWWFDIVNDTNKNDPGNPSGEFVWVTRYRLDPHFAWDSWAIVGAECVAPGQKILRDVQFPDEWPIEPAARVRAEVKAYGAKDCNAATISDFYSDKCSSTFSGNIDWIRGDAKIVVRPPHFDWDLHCASSQGEGTGP